MILLAIETTGANASVAIMDETKEIKEEVSDKKMSHLQNLIPLIDNLLEKCQLSIDDVTHIAVSEGPGSFTGIRIGMATGKALAQALNLPMISVPTLESFCYNDIDFTGLICPIFDARRHQVYGGAYCFDKGACRRVIKDDAWSLEGFLEKVDVQAEKEGLKVMFFGDGTEKYEEELKAWGFKTNRISPNDDISKIIAKDGQRYQRASSVVRLACKYLTAGKTKNLFEMNPVYLRMAEAERKLKGAL